MDMVAAQAEEATDCNPETLPPHEDALKHN